MNSIPKVSILVPVYNVEEYLRQCMDSIIHQTLREIEIICINDGSTDSSKKILDEYAQKDDRIRIIDKTNTGYGHSMNLGLDAACGEYVGIVESDDYVPPTMYKELYNLAVANDVDLLKADFYRFYSEGEGVEYVINKLSEDPSFYGRIIAPVERPDIFKAKMNTWSGIYKRSFLVENNIRHNETAGASYQDNGFWFQTIYFADRVYFHNKAYYMNRRDNPNSSVASTGKVYAMCDEFEFIDQIMKRYPDRCIQFRPYVMLKKFHNYEITYGRIAAEYRPEFLKRFRAEFICAQENGHLIPDVFAETEWERILWLLKDVELYRTNWIELRLRRQVDALQAEICAIKGSASFKLGRKITAPLRGVRDIARRIMDYHQTEERNEK